MKLKYVFILWAEVIGIPILLFLVLSSLGVPTATSLWIIIIVLLVTLGITIPQIMKEERANQLESLLENEAIRKLKQKEKPIMILFVCFLVIGALLAFFSSYYAMETVASGNRGAEVLSTLAILGGIGSLLLGSCWVLIILWALLRDKQKKMKSEILKEEIDKVLKEKYRIRS